MLFTLLASLLFLTRLQNSGVTAWQAQREKHPYYAKIENLKDKNQRDQLSKVVEYLNGNIVLQHDLKQESKSYEKDSKQNQADDLDLFEEVQDKRRPIQKNVADGLTPGMRIHVIKNPEVLKQYVNRMRRRDTSSSSDSSSEFDFKRKLKEDASDIRRSANFRISDDKSYAAGEDLEPKNEERKRKLDIRDSVEDQGVPSNIQKVLITGNQYLSSIQPSIKNNSYKKKRSDSMDNSFEEFTAMNDLKDDVNTKSRNIEISSERKRNDGHREHKTKSNKRNEHDWKNVGKRFDNDEYAKVALRGGNDSKHKKRKEDDWKDVMDRAKKSKVDNDWSKIGQKGLSTIHKTVWDDILETTKNTWKKTERKKSHVVDTSFSKSYKPRYENKRIARDRGGGGFNGRTPIPFIGRHGIYEDKK